jgi:hypothetical protein
MQLRGLFGTLCVLILSLCSTLLPGQKVLASQWRRTSRSTSLSVKQSATPAKYFHESNSCDHCDARYGERALSYIDRRRGLSALIRAYLSTMEDIGVETWLMHGSLLGWFWNRKIMPWDTDVDVQITERSMQHLADYYNMSVHHYNLPGSSMGHDYLLEINPNWADPSSTDVDNKIDGRWVDMMSGLYVDMTTLRWAKQAEAGGRESAMMCKDGHRYEHKDIFPLRDTAFEGVPAKVPFAYANVLAEEYGASSLTNTIYKQHRYDVDLQEWVLDSS